MAALAVVLGEHIEEEGLHVVVERLVVEEQLDEQAEVLTVDLVGVPVHLKHGHAVLPVDFHPGRMSPRTFLQMLLKDGSRLHVLQTELTEKEFGKLGVLLESQHQSLFKLLKSVKLPEDKGWNTKC